MSAEEENGFDVDLHDRPTGPQHEVSNDDLKAFMIRRFDQLHLDIANNYMGLSNRVAKLEKYASQDSRSAIRVGAFSLAGLLVLKLWITILGPVANHTYEVRLVNDSGNHTTADP